VFGKQSPAGRAPCKACVKGRCELCNAPRSCTCFHAVHADAVAMRIPQRCAGCAGGVVPHCPSPSCLWSYCKTCRRATGYVGAKVNSILTGGM
jgi:hypothetical protein